MELFKKGEKVVITSGGNNNTDANDTMFESGHIIVHWRDKTYEIEGTVKLPNNGNLEFLSYLLTIDGVPQGFIYHVGLKLAPKIFHYTHVWSKVSQTWVEYSGILGSAYNPVLLGEGIYLLTLKNPDDFDLYKGSYK